MRKPTRLQFTQIDDVVQVLRASRANCSPASWTRRHSARRNCSKVTVRPTAIMAMTMAKARRDAPASGPAANRARYQGARRDWSGERARRLSRMGPVQAALRCRRAVILSVATRQMGDMVSAVLGNVQPAECDCLFWGTLPDASNSTHRRIVRESLTPLSQRPHRGLERHRPGDAASRQRRSHVLGRSIRARNLILRKNKLK